MYNLIVYFLIFTEIMKKNFFFSFEGTRAERRGFRFLIMMMKKNNLNIH